MKYEKKNKEKKPVATPALLFFTFSRWLSAEVTFKIYIHTHTYISLYTYCILIYNK